MYIHAGGKANAAGDPDVIITGVEPSVGNSKEPRLNTPGDATSNSLVCCVLD